MEMDRDGWWPRSSTLCLKLVFGLISSTCLKLVFGLISSTCLKLVFGLIRVLSDIGKDAVIILPSKLTSSITGFMSSQRNSETAVSLTACRLLPQRTLSAINPFL